MSISRAEHNLTDNYGLWLVHKPRAPLRAVCDIVAVHGLGGGAASTWKHKETSYLWLRDCLPNILEDIPRGTSVRIWTFGYNANTVFSPAVAGLAEFTQSLLSYVDVNKIGHDGRRVIFVAHSLGGVVVKSALIDAALHNSKHAWLLDATIGIIFLGTPHQGSRIADKGLLLSRIAKYTGVVEVNRDVLRLLKRNSGELFGKVEQFKGICGHMKLFSFFETLTLGSMGLIVEKSSAVMNLPNETPIMMNADHRSICKFSGHEDQNLKLVKGSIRQLITESIYSSTGNPYGALPLRPPPSNNNGGPGRVGLYGSSGYPDPQGNSGHGRSQHWGNYRPPYVSPYPDDDDRSSVTQHEDYESRPSTSSTYNSSWAQSQESFQQQAPQRPARPSFMARSRSPPAQQRRNRAASNDSRQWNTQQMQDMPGHDRSQSADFPSANIPPNHPTPEANTSAVRSPYLQPRPSGYSLNRTQLEETNRDTSPAARQAVSTSPARGELKPQLADWTCDACSNGFSSRNPRLHCEICEDYDLCLRCHQRKFISKSHSAQHKITAIAIDSDDLVLPPQVNLEEVAYSCDVCFKDYGLKDGRFHCTICEDYDLCNTCYQSRGTSKGHSTEHKMTPISGSHHFTFGDITPANVTPEISPPRKLPNWTIDQLDRRWSHLRESPAHERYIIHGLSRGAYAIQLKMEFKFSEFISVATMNSLKSNETSLGELKVIVGPPIDTKVFFTDLKATTEAGDLSSQLFASGRVFTLDLKTPANLTNPMQAWEQHFDFTSTPIFVGKDAKVNKSSETVAIMLQWSGVQEFEESENPVLLAHLNFVRMDELLEYDDPPATPPPAPRVAPKPSPSPNNEEEDEDDQVTIDELLQATQVLLSNNQPVTPDNLVAVVMQTRNVQTQFQKALLLGYIQEIQRQQRAEKAQRERLAAQREAQSQQAAAELLLWGFLLSGPQ